ncbi:MAG: hypothetical protein ABSE89_08820 [Sedimentisphaerales bacterium]
MLKFFLALRYLKKKKIVFLSIVAVALSTALLVTVASLFTAFIKAVESSSADYLGDIVLDPPQEIYHSDELADRLSSEKEIAAASAVLSTNGLIHFGPGNVKAVSIWGIDLPSRCKVTDMKNNLIKQGDNPSVPQFDNEDKTVIPVFVGIGLLAEPDDKTDEYDLAYVKSFIGDDAVVTVGSAQGKSQANELRSRSAKVRISDVVRTSVYDIDKRFIFMPIDRLAEILNKQNPKPADIIHIKCAAGYNPEQTVSVVRRIWTEFAGQRLNWPTYFAADAEIMTSVARQSQYTAELRKQMGVLLVIFGVISAGVIVLVFCIFYMIVAGKLKDLAIIKSVGGSAFTSASIFLIFGLFTGLLGASIGIGIGYAITHYVNAMERWISLFFGLKLWSSSIYMFSRIPNNFNWFWAWRFFGAAVAASVLGALLPAIAAARTFPAKILRYE